jgi:eukaryotic-like serine/threonine-protein kinase
MLKSGTRLGPYEVIDRLGAGGMGEVYRARDSRLGREIAVKILPEHLSADPSARARFEREAKAIAAITHPNILSIHDFGIDSGIYYTITELLEGSTLRARINEGAIPWREAIEIGGAMADGLAHAHGKGIVHRDLKPENVFLTHEGRVKILDFGLAQASEATVSAADETSPLAMSTPGRIIGTLGYMSPEQLRGEPIDEATDIFAFGCVMHEMVTGNRAFWRDTPVDTIASILHDQPRDIEKLRAVVPPEIESLILGCLAKVRDQRFQSARDLAMTLRAITSRSGGSLVPMPDSLATKPRKRRRRIDSLAVLPFATPPADENLEYLADGITEQLIHSVSDVPKLRVLAASTVFRYKSAVLDPIAIGRKLDVATVVTGRMRLSPDGRLVVNVELVDANDGTQLWGQRFQTKGRDVLALQEEIGEKLNEQLHARMSPSRKRRPKKARRAVDSEAWQLYLKGRFQWNRRTMEGIRSGIHYFEQAIEKDPGFALAYAGIADCSVTLATNVPLSPREMMPRAKAAAQRALELDPDLAEARAALGSVLFYFEWDWAGAEAEFQRALALNPGSRTVQEEYGNFLSAMGRLDEGLARSREAALLDPLSVGPVHDIGINFMARGDYEESAASFRRAIEIDPNWTWGYIKLARALALGEKCPEAMAQCAIAEARIAGGAAALSRSWLGANYARCGETARARLKLDELHALARTQYVDPVTFAVVHGALGEMDEALRWHEKALEDRTPNMVYASVASRIFPELAASPRYEAIVRSLGFPPPGP